MTMKTPMTAQRFSPVSWQTVVRSWLERLWQRTSELSHWCWGQIAVSCRRLIDAGVGLMAATERKVTSLTTVDPSKIRSDTIRAPKPPPWWSDMSINGGLLSIAGGFTALCQSNFIDMPTVLACGGAIVGGVMAILGRVAPNIRTA